MTFAKGPPCRYSVSGKGKLRKRLPVSLAIALATAGASGRRPTSLIPPGSLSVGMTLTLTVTLTTGVWLARSRVCASSFYTLALAD